MKLKLKPKNWPARIFLMLGAFFIGRQYVFVPVVEFETMWSDDCLDELSGFIRQQMVA